MSASGNVWSGCPQLVVVSNDFSCVTTRVQRRYTNKHRHIYLWFLIRHVKASVFKQIWKFIGVMVDGFGLDIVAKLTLAHSSDDSALSGSRHTNGKLENVIHSWKRNCGCGWQPFESHDNSSGWQTDVYTYITLGYLTKIYYCGGSSNWPR